ncbi:uncharacterized protein Z519_04420 [Cladophialophora bantiana CBS 173.52]|uniref:DUF5648 domain-containing protein n=1 Tax=Cladophialophora bantiana (strain ATCC 10958 / CBS 173.52 / CDC B-1940 / NIH 8579) TaxID=1442370 RepID=A0A0D2ICD9_CLAB1|nr:uncharacterized protein Z519_04420 [Cladophialophora bantiana CBS 173.52]KIW94444.1 hypothetical protein Z519_04420 [Cladophialophora bantiana CBS 173.52]
MLDDHFYTLDFRGELAPGRYEREGVPGYVYSSQQPGIIPIFCCYDPDSGDHFYTADPTGEFAPQNYRYEGVGWYMFRERIVSTFPLYRWYNQTNGDHFYTTNTAGYLHDISAPNSVPLYRWYKSGLLSNFTFDPAITPTQKSTLLERHTWAYYRAGRDPSATVFRRFEEPRVNASAFVGAQSPLGDNEIVQTLLHEMMDCAGYTHPVRIDPPAPNAGVPYDGGKYYGTPPLRAELCIAGQ